MYFIICVYYLLFLTLTVVTPDLKSSLVKVLGLLKDAAESFSKVPQPICVFFCLDLQCNNNREINCVRVRGCACACVFPGLVRAPGDPMRPDGQAGRSSAPLPEPGFGPACHQPATCRDAEHGRGSATVLPGPVHVSHRNN